MLKRRLPSRQTDAAHFLKPRRGLLENGSVMLFSENWEALRLSFRNGDGGTSSEGLGEGASMLFSSLFGFASDVPSY